MATAKLRGIVPEVKKAKRAKIALKGGPKVGKTTAAIQMPRPYVIDTEGGAEHEEYAKKIIASGGVWFGPKQGSLDPDECAKEVETLATTRHPYLTLVWDSFTMSHEAMADIGAKNPKIGIGYSANYRLWADPWAKRMWRMMLNMDMNIVVTEHVKAEYKDGARIGNIGDGYKKTDYMGDVVIEIEKLNNGENAPRIAIVRGSRYPTQFPDGARFDWSIEEFVRRMGDGMLSDAIPMELATPEQVVELERKVKALNISREETDKWLSKTDSESFADMTTDAIAKCIAYLDKRIAEAGLSIATKSINVTDTTTTKETTDVTA